MRRSRVRMLVAGYLALFAFLATWPGVALINRIHPLMFGLPFNLFALAMLVSGGLIALAALYWSEESGGPDDGKAR